MRARPQLRHWHAEMFPHGPFARVHKDHAGGEEQRRQLRQQQQRQVFLQQLEKPRLRNLEAELVVQRLRRRREQAFGLREQAHEPAVVKRPGDFALHARAVDFQQQRDENFRRHQAQQHAKSARDEKIRAGKLRLDAGDGQRGE